MTGADENGTPVLQDMKRPPTMRELMSHTAGFGYGLADEHPVDKLYREKGVLAANGLEEMINRTADDPADVPAGDERGRIPPPSTSRATSSRSSRARSSATSCSSGSSRR